MALVVRAAAVAGRLVVAPFVGFGLLGWWLVGDVSEPGGEDFIVQLPLAQRNSVSLGLVGLAFVVGWCADFVVVWRRSEPAAQAFWLSTIAVSAGVLAGAAMRVVTARVGGANIGGGMVILASPVAGLALIAATVALSLRIARR